MASAEEGSHCQPQPSKEGAEGGNDLTSPHCSPGSCHCFPLAEPNGKPEREAWPMPSPEVSLQGVGEGGKCIGRVKYGQNGQNRVVVFVFVFWSCVSPVYMYQGKLSEASIA